MGAALAFGALLFAIWVGLIHLGKYIISRARGWWRVPAWIIALALVWGPLTML